MPGKGKGGNYLPRKKLQRRVNEFNAVNLMRIKYRNINTYVNTQTKQGEFSSLLHNTNMGILTGSGMVPEIGLGNP